MHKAAPVDRSGQLWILASVVLTLLPLLPRLTLEVGVIASLPLLWQGWRLRNASPTPTPNRLVLLLMAVVAVAATVARYGTAFGRTPGLALLAMLLGLKLLETRTRRDAHITIQLCFFVQLGYFLIEQSVVTALSAFAACILALTALLRVEQPDLSLKPALSGSARMVGIALPLAALLFVLFPRIDSPLWSMPSDGASATTGMSDRMRPGTIADLSLSGEIAFRVEFSGPIPPPAERYFRGPVMSHFDGMEWQSRPAIRAASLPHGSRRIDYVITLEPNQNRWLFALEHATPRDGQTLDAANVLLASAAVRTRVRTALTSFTDARIGLDISPTHLATNLELPAGSNPRVAAFGARLRQDNPAPADRVAAALNFLRKGDFVYTLSPPRLGRNAADDFLFETRQGFCEHFANAFTVLMRSAGVPARVVAGYQGGEVNPIDGTLVVRQSDAHAWSEVWLAERGWVRVDPTAAAAPRRIDGGLTASLPASDPIPGLVRIESQWLRTLRNRAEAMSHAWNTWILGYNAQRQRDLFAGLGFDADWRNLTIGLVASGALWQAAVWVGMFRSRRRQTPAERAWQLLLRKLGQHGIEPAISEGPIAFAARAGTIHPEWHEALADFAARYARLTYGPTAPAAEAEALRLDINAWLTRTF
ncbi:DUF3488 and DUF4129 domain-containing transglutaminase family protein [Niveibacterium sp.]|uniref:transglutaminase TgpA family protein n=1 Tax=Niveibacterium sp. TaxID=2017444 RepID=UPI0035B1D7F5